MLQMLNPPTSNTHLYLDPDQPIAARVADLVGRMTIEEKLGQLVFNAPAIERLGIPAYNWWGEALHGIARNGRATVFPQAIGMAATWDPDSFNGLLLPSATRAAPSITLPCAALAKPATTRDSPSGRPMSTSSATRAGDAARRPGAKTPS